MTAEPCASTMRLTVPAELEHAALVRACLRDAVVFTSSDHESRFLLAVTEIVINAIEATGQCEVADERAVVVTLAGCPPDVVEVRDEAGGFSSRPPKPGHLGAGLTIAEALVEDVRVRTDALGTTVTLGLRTMTR